jgi:UrcA family protein
MFKSLLPALAGVSLAALAIAPNAARAQSSQDSASVRISYADLNLSSPQDARKMMDRIESAARFVCGDSSSSVDLSERAREGACVDAAVSDAVHSLAAPSVTALSDHRRGAAFVASR